MKILWLKIKYLMGIDFLEQAKKEIENDKKLASNKPFDKAR
jgi:hypothetical protein